MLTLYLFLISVFHGSDVSRRYSLGHESIHRANYWYPLCSESMMNTHNQQIWEHLVVSQVSAENICERLITAHCCSKFADCPCGGSRIYSPRFLKAQLIYIRPTDLFYSLAFDMIIVPGDFLNGIVTLGLNLPHD